MKQSYIKTPFISTVLIFIGTLIILTLARTFSGNNPYLYFFFPAIWFLLIFIRELKTKHQLITQQWQAFKEKKWRNILIIIISLFLLSFIVQLTRPFFNQFIPEHPIESYSFNINSGLGLLFTFFSGILDLIVAFVEEITYRYEGMYVYRKNKLLLATMLILSSILFGFSHYYNFGGSFLATGPYIFAGLYLGIIYLITQNIWVPIIAHLLFNSSSVLSSLLLIIFYFMN